MNAIATQPLTQRIDRMSPEGRIAWHVNQAAEDRAVRLIEVARVATAAAHQAAARVAA